MGLPPGRLFFVVDRINNSCLLVDKEPKSLLPRKPAKISNVARPYRSKTSASAQRKWCTALQRASRENSSPTRHLPPQQPPITSRSCAHGLRNSGLQHLASPATGKFSLFLTWTPLPMCSCDTTQRSRPLLRRTMAHSKFWDVLTKPSQSTCGGNEKSSPLTAPSLLILRFPFKQPLTYDFTANHWTLTFRYSARNCCPSLKAPQSRGGAFVAEAAQHHRILFYPVSSRP